MLNEKLLINERSLKRFPHEYNHSDFYLRIFDSQIFSIFSSVMSKMFYMIARDIENYQLHFDKRIEYVIIKMRKKNIISETISHESFRRDFLSTLIDEYTH